MKSSVRREKLEKILANCQPTGEYTSKEGFVAAIRKPSRINPDSRTKKSKIRLRESVRRLSRARGLEI